MSNAPQGIKRYVRILQDANLNRKVTVPGKVFIYITSFLLIAFFIKCGWIFSAIVFISLKGVVFIVKQVLADKNELFLNELMRR